MFAYRIIFYNFAPTYMPKIFEYFGFIFFFYSNEHEPIHVHVTHNNCGMVFELILDKGKLVEVRHRRIKSIDPLPSKEIKEVSEFISNYWPNIIDKWVNFFVKKKRVRCTNITTKL